MKTITFFSEKGGVGKTSFAMMYASWLHSQFGVKVALADFNDRVAGYRRKEIIKRNKMIETHPELGLQPFDEKKAWPILTCKNGDIEKAKRDFGPNVPHAKWFQNEVENGALRGMEIVVCDFPGSMSGKEYQNMFNMDLLCLTVIPVEKDEMTIQSTLKLNYGIRSGNRCAFVTKAQVNMRNIKGSYYKLAKLMRDQGVPMLPDLISYSERMKSMDKVDNIRSTFGIPDFGSSKDLGIINLFTDVSKLLARSADIRGTEPYAMSFAEGLKKNPDPDRQFKPSSFPEFDM